MVTVTILGLQVMVTVPLYILIHVGGLPIYCYRQSTIGFWFDSGIQEGDGMIILVVFLCKLYGQLKTVNVFKVILFVTFLLDDRSIIHIPESHSRGWVAVLRAFCSKYSI